MALYDFDYGFKTLRGEQAAAQTDEMTTWRSARGALEAIESDVPPEDAARIKQAVDAKAQEAAQPTSDRSAMIITLVMIITGILAHWVWETLAAGLKTNIFDFGSGGVVIARIVIAAIVGVLNFIGIWKQLDKVDPTLRIFFAFTQGFALDALTSPLATAAAT